jgi:MarR family transcriptional regulator, organic hydroperoxide resistance regulator
MEELWDAIMPIPPVTPKRIRDKVAPEAALHALLIRSILQLSGELQKRMDVFVRPFDLTMQRMAVLLVLFFSDQQLSPSELGERLFVTRGNMTGLIEGLVSEGLVHRVRRANDRRAHDLELTERGLALVEEYIPHHRRALAGLLGALDATESIQLAKLLHKLRGGMVSLEPVKRNAPDDDGRDG